MHHWLLWLNCLDVLDTLKSHLVCLNESLHLTIIKSIIEIVTASTGQGGPHITALCAETVAVTELEA